ncbi:MAG: 1-deoxy-D-xylulose-5-phosphate reductoisomerase [Burkholderiales bacterium]|nr:1-deoxy-D-xylulose-5-phosphate reductoisomerase [Burkholderiales bacterium]
MRNLTILGATGTIGRNTLDVTMRHPDRFRVVALAGGSRWEPMLELCRVHRPRYAALVAPDAAALLRERVKVEGLDCQVLAGERALAELAALDEVDTVMAAIVGAAGLAPTLAAARAGKRVLLANKEALVMAGGLFMETVRRHGAELLPIDSEHNAVFQSLPAGYDGELRRAGVRRILLTASGGPFRTMPLERFAAVTPDEACAHPNWVMGRKISVDSATMMNKGLEVIEAHWLFGAPASHIEVVIHPQSVVHSLVEYEDGSVIAQLGNPDMRTPIAHALSYPERIASGVSPLDLAAAGGLTFEKPDTRRFPCLALAYDALDAGQAAMIALNAANECAVARFLAGGLRFDHIPILIEAVVARTESGPVQSLDEALRLDAAARREATQWLERRAA